MIFCEVDHTTFSSFAAYAQRTVFSSGQCKYDELHLGLASSASFCEVHLPNLSFKNTIQALYVDIMPVKYICYTGYSRDSKSGERGEHVRAIFLTLLC